MIVFRQALCPEDYFLLELGFNLLFEFLEINRAFWWKLKMGKEV